MTVRALLASGCLLWLTACTDSPETTPRQLDDRILHPPATVGLTPVLIPELSAMSDVVQHNLEAQFATLRQALAADLSPDTLAGLYGDVGALLLAARYFSESTPYFLNAQVLAPGDRRWPYYLGHVYRNVGPLDEAAHALEQANQMHPNDVATEVWLGEVYLAQGRASDAATLFSAVTAREPTSAAGWFGAGRAALADGEPADAVTALEEALTHNPAATAVHYPLAMAYRRLGQLDEAQTHLAQQGGVAPRPDDPLMSALGELLESPEVYSSRGRSALVAGNWAAAADLFERGLTMAPTDPFLRHGFGGALLRMGDQRGAETQFRRVIQDNPTHVEAYYSLSELLEATGRPGEAVAALRTALEYAPGHVAARTRLAGILGRSGAPADALPEFIRALELAPENAEAAFGYGMGLVRLDRFQAARDAFSEGMQTFPDPTPFALALARLLAAAPDPGVRDGQQALNLAENLLEETPGLALGETIAMALAELGRFGDATQMQRDVMTVAQQAGIDRTVILRMNDNLLLYENGRASRRPFRSDEMP